jgi:hypothetical protein
VYCSASCGGDAEVAGELMKIRQGFASNSSSSSFVCKTDLSIKEVKRELESMISHLGAVMKEDYIYDEIFGDIVKTEKEINQAESWYVNNDGDWARKRFAEASIIIRSASDNTIPYYMHEIIEEKFDAFRIHRG